MNHDFRVDQCFKLFLSLTHAHTHTHSLRSAGQGRLGLLSMVYLKKGDVYKRERDMLMPKVLLSLQIL